MSINPTVFRWTWRVVAYSSCLALLWQKHWAEAVLGITILVKFEFADNAIMELIGAVHQISGVINRAAKARAQMSGPAVSRPGEIITGGPGFTKVGR